MADVTVVRRIDDDSIDMLKLLGQAAIDRAFARARSRIEAYAKEITPVETGRLRASVKVGMTPQYIAVSWSAVDPRTGFKYSSVVDTGRAGGVPIVAKTSRGLVFKVGGRWIRTMSVTQGAMWGSYFGDEIRMVAPQIVRQELIKEFSKIGPSAGPVWRPPTGRQGF
jgi:hypothetical protein